MANELDHIRAQTDCPQCGSILTVTFRSLRLGRTIECPGCGETVKLIDETRVGDIQRLIDEAEQGRKPC